MKTEQNRPIFKDVNAAKLLGSVLRDAQQLWPFEITAIVLLPDHLHAIWSLPRGDAEYSKRWGWIKKEFTKQYLACGGKEAVTTLSRRHNRRRGVWQRRYWEHTIQDEDDHEAHFDYVHWNPVKHGYVSHPADWPNSTFHRWVKRGVYPQAWGSGETPPTSFQSLTQAGE